MEPTLRGYGDQVIHSPTTSVMDIHQALNHISANLPPNVELVKGATVTNINNGEGRTAECHYTTAESRQIEKIDSRMFINAAGNHALRLAHSQNLARNYVMLPLKGRYAISKEAEMGDKYKMIVYPVPVKGAYVLGVHSTLAVSGHVKLGPTVFPAFSPENYDSFGGLTLGGIVDALGSYGRVLLSPKTRGLVWAFADDLEKSFWLEAVMREGLRI